MPTSSSQLHRRAESAEAPSAPAPVILHAGAVELWPCRWEDMIEHVRARVDVVICDPPYGMGHNIDSTRYRPGKGTNIVLGSGRSDWPEIICDDQPFDPAPWLGFARVVLWGSHHFAQRLPVGTTLVWIKKPAHLFGTFLSDAELAWMKGGHGVYCFEGSFPPPTRIAENDGQRAAHPTQKPIALMAWSMERAGVPAGATVLDPFMGSATTALACIRTGRRFIGSECQPAYFATAVKRIRRELDQGDWFRGTLAAEQREQLTLPAE